MRIYPDPELPDVDVEWFEGDCRPGTGDVAISLIGVDDPALRTDVTVPCADLQATFEDVARERFRLIGTLRDLDGEVFSNSWADLDLRDGLDERASLYLGAFANFRVGWAFDLGASCESLGADAVLIDLISGPMSGFGTGAPCELSPHLTNVPFGVYTITLRAIAGEAIVAVAPDLADVVIDADALTDLGTVVLTPCGPSCPP